MDSRPSVDRIAPRHAHLAAPQSSLRFPHSPVPIQGTGCPWTALEAGMIIVLEISSLPMIFAPPAYKGPVRITLLWCVSDRCSFALLMSPRTAPETIRGDN